MTTGTKPDAAAAPSHPAPVTRETPVRESQDAPPATDAVSVSRAAALGDVEGEMNELVGHIRSDARDAAIAVDPALQPFGLKVLRLIALRGPLQSSAIARALFVDRSVISRQITQLCELGLVDSHADADDGRVRMTTVTPLALARMEDMRGGDWSLASRLDTWDEPEIRQLARLLAKLNDR
jgi:DNA-binding MarR family transcriptional regulator